MKLRKVNFKNHPIFNDLELSFIDSNNQTYNTIIFAGENGVGKTILLNTLYKLLELPTSTDKVAILLGQQGSYEFELSEKEIDKIKQDQDKKKNNTLIQQNKADRFLKNLFDTKIINIEVENKNENENNTFLLNKLSNNTLNNTLINTALETALHNSIESIKKVDAIRSIFLDIEINFKSEEKVSSIKTSQIDTVQKYGLFNQLPSSHENLIKSQKDTPIKIKQLFVDLYNQDNATIIQANENNPENKSYTEIKSSLDLKINRFKLAFERIIDSKQMIKSKILHGSHEIIFKDLRNNQEITIDELSSGEKQIIYRGSFLLQHKGILDNPIVFIDEPEISLHPDWQIKVLDYYKNILTNPLTNQLEAQLFVVTHSPFILHNINLDTDKVIILERDEHGNVRQKQSNEFYNYKSPELIKSAFKLPAEMFTQDKNVIYVKGKTDEQYIKKALEIFGIDINIEISYIGKDSNDRNSGTGEGNLEKAVHYLRNNHTKYSNKVCILYDCDISDTKCKPELEVPNKLIIRKHNRLSNNRNMAKGIENLLVFPEELGLEHLREHFFDFKKEDKGYGQPAIIPILDKQKLADKICSYPKEQLKDILQHVFDSIKPIIDELEQM